MNIEPFDLKSADDQSALAYGTLVSDASAESTPEGLWLPPELVVNRDRNRSSDRVTYVWTASDGDALAGAAELDWFEAPDNRTKAWLNVNLPVFSADVADALTAPAAATAVAEGRPELTVDVPAGSALRDWVEARGGTLGSVEQHNVVRLRSVDRSDVEALAAAVPAGYELVPFDDAVPEDLIEQYTDLVATMNDAPRDNLSMEDWVYSPERVRRWEAGLAARGHSLWTVMAREIATGELAGFNQLVVRPDWPECVENEDTAVVRAHRGHGLGLWIKAVNLLRVLDQQPQAECIETWNAASNEHMLRVNRRLGFVCEHVWESWELAAPKLL